MHLEALMVEDVGASPMVDESNDHLMDQPVTRWHDLRNVLNQVQVTLAVVTERQTASTEQGRRIEKSVADMEQKLEKGVGAVETSLDGLGDRVTSLEQQFTPVKALVYGLVALMLTGVVGAIIAVVLR